MTEYQERLEWEILFYATALCEENIPMMAERVIQLDISGRSHSSIKKALRRADKRLYNRGIILLQKYEGITWCFIRTPGNIRNVIRSREYERKYAELGKKVSA